MSTSFIGAFNRIRLNGDITTTTGDSRMVVADNVHMIVSDSGALNTTIFNTGAAAVAYTNTISGILALQIAGSSAGVSAVNGLSGAISIVGSGNTKVLVDGQTIIVYDSGLANSGDLTSLSNTIAATGQQAWNAANNNGLNLSGQVSTLTTNLGLTGQTLHQRDLDISGALHTLIRNADADVSSINGQSGVIQITGVGLITVASGGQGLINVSVDTSTLATTANLTQTGVQLGSKIDSLSGYSNSTFATLTNLANTGQQAWSAANNNAINLSGNATQTGVQLGLTIASTGQQLNNLIVGLSGTLTGYVEVSTERIVRTEIPTGVDYYLINWSPNYPSRPRLVQPTVEISTGITTYFTAAQGITISGYTVLLSDTVMETGVFVNTWAKL